MTSLRLCRLKGILTMQRQGWGTGKHSPDMLLQQLFSFLCSQFILCNPLFPPLSLNLTLSPVLSLSNTGTAFIFSFSSPFSFFSSISLCLLPGLRESYQVASQIIRHNICLKTQRGIILSLSLSTEIVIRHDNRMFLAVGR